MPRHRVPMKDVAHCDKPREAVCRLRSGDFRMGKPVAETQVFGVIPLLNT